jgi:hypothetical protein
MSLGVGLDISGWFADFSGEQPTTKMPKMAMAIKIFSK